MDTEKIDGLSIELFHRASILANNIMMDTGIKSRKKAFQYAIELQRNAIIMENDSKISEKVEAVKEMMNLMKEGEQIVNQIQSDNCAIGYSPDINNKSTEQ